MYDSLKRYGRYRNRTCLFGWYRTLILLLTVLNLFNTVIFKSHKIAYFLKTYRKVLVFAKIYACHSENFAKMKFREIFHKENVNFRSNPN